METVKMFGNLLNHYLHTSNIHTEHKVVAQAVS